MERKSVFFVIEALAQDPIDILFGETSYALHQKYEYHHHNQLWLWPASDLSYMVLTVVKKLNAISFLVPPDA